MNLHSPRDVDGNPTRPCRAKPSLVYPHMSFCREERGRAYRQSGGGCVGGPTLQIFDLARKMDMEGQT